MFEVVGPRFLLVVEPAKWYERGMTIERLAIPAWNAASRRVEEWVEALGEGCALDRERDGTAWIEIDSMGLRGFALIEGGFVVAIDFELSAADPSPALQRLEAAAKLLEWELYSESGDDDD